MRKVYAMSAEFGQSPYDAANTTTDRDFGIFYGLASEDLSFTDNARFIAITRIRKEVRNNPYLAGLIAKLPEAIGSSSMRSRTGDRAYDIAKESWYYKISKKVTSAGLSMRAVESVLWPELAMCGEVFFIKLGNGRLQMQASEFCGGMRYNIINPDGSCVVNGIAYDRFGAPTAYRFGRKTSWGGISFTDADSTVIPADKVIHVFSPDRIEMGRGLPWVLPSIATARDLYEITRSKTKQIKDITGISYVLEKAQATTSGLSGLSGMRSFSDPENEPEASTAPADKQDEVTPKIKVSPGTVIELEPGEKLMQMMSKYEASDYKELIMLMLHAIATPIGLPVELWFSGLGDINYSGFKGLGAQWSGRRRHLIAFIEETFLEPYLEWRTEYAQTVGELVRNRAVDDTLYDWRWKRASVLDDDKQASSVSKRLASGESCLADVWEENGSYQEEELLKRRNLYIEAMKAAGEIAVDADTENVKVPLEFLLKNEITPSKPETPQPTAEDIAEAVAGRQEEEANVRN